MISKRMNEKEIQRISEMATLKLLRAFICVQKVTSAHQSSDCHLCVYAPTFALMCISGREREREERMDFFFVMDNAHSHRISIGMFWNIKKR